MTEAQHPSRYEAPLLRSDELSHGFFTRKGGVSTGLYQSLNCGFGSNDARDAVAENRARVAALLNVSSTNLVTLRQTHSAHAAILDEGSQPGVIIDADAVVTRQRGLAVAVLTADCAPVLLTDIEAGVVAAAHAGWRGALGGILEATIAAMQTLGAKPERIRAAVGPCISVVAYEVGDDFKKAFTAAAFENAEFFEPGPNGDKPHFDLARFVSARLQGQGITQVEIFCLCTLSCESDYFSYRRSQQRGEPDYGRQISAIVLR
ncbi:MAG: peptidoglycan editing factor PgeF [Hyphomicrobiales bacterium]|nr:peptidoglycan editing factor PgeF [Hyphomicrobiales bacterium]